MSGDTGDDHEQSGQDGDVHGFEHAPFEPEIGAIEIDPVTGEIPIVVVNSRQPHYQAIRAIKAWRERWRERLVLPPPLLALIDLIKEYPLGAAIGAGTAAVLTATSVAVTVLPPSPPPPVPTIIGERLEGTQMSSSAIQLIPDRVPTAALPRQGSTRSPSPSRMPRSSATPASPPPPTTTPTLPPSSKPESARASASSSGRHTTAHSPTATTTTPPEDRPVDKGGESTSPPASPTTLPPEPSPQKSTLLPPVDVDVPLIDEDPLVEGVCGLLPIGCPID